MAALLYTVFFVSGAAALLFETLWFRQAGLAFGNSIWASSLVLSGFMGGLALGNALAARYGDRLRNALRAYAVAEAAIAVTGLGLVLLLPWLGAALAPVLRPLLTHGWILNPLRFLIAFLLLLVPSTAMGITLPLLTRTLAREDARFGSVLGRLYGWNTFGAVAGALLGETLLLAALGVRGTAVAAAALNLLAAGAAWSLSSRLLPAKPSKPGAQPVAAVSPRGVTPWLIAATLAGSTLLALEIVWFRLLLLVVKGHATAFALMLAVVLAGIALGGLAAALWLRRSQQADQAAAPIAFAAGALCIASYALFPALLEPLAAQLIVKPGEILRLALPLMLPVSLLSGCFFTLAGSALQRRLGSATRTTGVLTLCNTTGAALGALAAGFLLLPTLGVERSVFVLAILYGGIGLLLLWRETASRRVGYGCAAILGVSLALFPFGLMRDRLIQVPVDRALGRGTESRLLAVREGQGETIVYAERMLLGLPLNQAMLTNAYSMSGNTERSRRYMKLYVYWPMALHPSLKRALLIGFGVGNTAKALVDSRSLESIQLVELSRDILAMSRTIFPNDADNPLRDPRVRVQVEDGRYFLQTTDQRFDLITGEPPPPGIAGVENLYSREYFQLLHDRLNDGGMVSYWLPIHSLADVSTKAIVAAFCTVFTDCSLWHGWGMDLMLIGTRKATGPVSEEHFLRQWRDSTVARELTRLGFEQPQLLGTLFIGDAEYLRGIIAGARPLTDNDPKLIEAPLQSAEEASRMLASFTDAPAARARFASSPFIKGLWPERLLAGSLPYFEVQAVLNAQFYGRLTPGSAAIEVVHGLLTQSGLKAPVLWLLKSDSDIQQAIARATPDALAQPLLQYHLGVRQLAERNYAAAVEPFSNAQRAGDPETSQDAFRFRVYALAMSGQLKEAQRLASESLAAAQRQRGVQPGSIQLPPFWQWMNRTFAIDPLRPPASAASP